MSLLDKLRGQLGKTGQVEQNDETRRVESLQQGLTGRESAGSSSPRTSTLAERISLGQARQQEDEQAQKEQVQSEQLRLAEDAQLQSLTDQQLGLVERSLDTKQQVSQRTSQLLDELERGNKQLDFQKDAARFEQIGFDLRMNNKKYIDQLNQAAQRGRIDDAAQFREELQRAIFEEERSLFDNSLEFRRMMDSDTREFTRELSELSIEQALEIARTQTDQANRLGKYQSIGQIIGAGAQGYASYQQSSKEEDE